jgi:glucose/arabinose dehydrogenase/plastocyanin
MKDHDLIVVWILIIATSIGCAGGAQPRIEIVEIKDFSFQPASINISPGTTVTWINRDPVEHTVSATDGSFNSGNIATGGVFNLTFNRSGTYQYQCLIHTSMVGYVIVNSSASDANRLKVASSSGPVVGLRLVVEGLTAPMEFISSGDQTGRMFAVDQIGLIRVVTSDGKVQPDAFLDIRDHLVSLTPNYDERGLLSLAFHPDFARNGKVYVFYSAPLRSGAPDGWSCTNHLSEFTVSKENPDIIDPGSERIILQIDKPQMNHNGGTIAFGPDGYLYVPIGDGGGANDVGEGHAPGGNGQNTSTLLGKIIRIDVDNASAGSYGIPSDNPFVGKAGYLPEIWAYGLRNPWRISFDIDGRLFASDAGQNLWEEVDIITKGGNYGWNIREGAHCFDPGSPNKSPAICPDKGRKGEPLIDPIIDYDGHGINRTVVVGGYIYRGKALPEFEGDYIFGDWSSSFAKGDGTLLVAMPPTSNGTLWRSEEITVAGTGRVNAFVRSFGRDDEGELYLLTSDVAGPSKETGKIYKIVARQTI